MTTALKSTSPPAPTAQSVRSHRKMLEIEHAALRASGPGLAMASALGDQVAKADLAALHAKLAALQFEIDCNESAVQLARAADQAAENRWRSAIQELPVEEIISGIGKSACCSLCVQGTFCVITASATHSGGVCGHPILTKDLQHLDETGKRLFAYRDTPRCAELYAACCRKLKVPTS